MINYDELITNLDELNEKNNNEGLTAEETKLQKEYNDIISKKIASVVLMNEYEKAKSKGIIHTLKFTTSYVFPFPESKEQLKKDIKMGTKNMSIIDKIISIITLPITIPLTIALLTIYTGYRGVKLIEFINNEPKFINALKKAGKYEEVVQTIKNWYVNIDFDKDLSSKDIKELSTTNLDVVFNSKGLN